MKRLREQIKAFSDKMAVFKVKNIRGETSEKQFRHIYMVYNEKQHGGTMKKTELKSKAKEFVDNHKLDIVVATSVCAGVVVGRVYSLAQGYRFSKAVEASIESTGEYHLKAFDWVITKPTK